MPAQVSKIDYQLIKTVDNRIVPFAEIDHTSTMEASVTSQSRATNSMIVPPES